MFNWSPRSNGERVKKTQYLETYFLRTFHKDIYIHMCIYVNVYIHTHKYLIHANPINKKTFIPGPMVEKLKNINNRLKKKTG